MSQPTIALQFITPDVLPADFAQVIVGPQGPKGDKGDTGNPGAGLHITGTLPDPSALPPTAQPGEAYLIAGELHVWDGAAWVNAGPIQGPPGPPGHPGQIRYTGLGPPPTVIVGAEPGDTYLDLNTGDIYKLT